MTTRSMFRFSGVSVAIAAAALVAGVAAQAPPTAQTPPAPAAKPAETPPSASGPLAPFAWLEGCWNGAVNQRDYREQWMPLRGNLMVGVSQTVMQDKTLGFEYLRLEPRADGIYYVAAPSGKNETAFRLTEQTTDRTADRNDEIFVFTNPALEFPQKITYRRGPSGWLYATVDGKVGGTDRQVIYPMRRVGCESGELITK